MAFVRYQSPDDTSFLVFDSHRFRVEHGLFLLQLPPLKEAIRARLDEQRDWNLRAMKLVQENQRLSSCLEWLETLQVGTEEVVLPDLKHEPAIDVVANRLIADHHYLKMFCPACEVEHTPDRIAVEAWSFEEDGTTVRGRRSVCPNAYTVHILTEEIETLDLENPD